MSKIDEIEETGKTFWLNEVKEDTINFCYEFLDEYYYNRKISKNLQKEFINFQRTYQHKNKAKKILKFSYLIYVYKIARKTGRYKEANKTLEELIKIKNMRENSGVMVYSIFTSGYPSYTKKNTDGTTELVKEFTDGTNQTGAFSCKYDCAYCPNYPDMPRSYLPGEPSVDRAIQSNFEVFKMITNRAKQYIDQGHPLDKAEVIIQGGTWDSYSYEYRTEFIRDVYYTFNVLMDFIFDLPLRERLSMEEEIKINETAGVRVVGLTPETRPDQINYKTIQFLRKIGATRVQLGIQHLDDKILDYIDRRCKTRETIKAIQMLKDNCFKVDCHLMLDLPAPEGYEGKMPEIDRQMLIEFNTNPKFKVDQIKIYPCVVTPYTKIEKWYRTGKYKPYGETRKLTHEQKIAERKLTKNEKMRLRLENPLYKNIFDFYQIIHPSIRINRIIRDIPSNVIIGGTTQSGMRAEIDNDLELINSFSTCIRYREAGNTRNLKREITGNPILKEIKFESSNGTEYFLTWESEGENPILYSFLRLRLSKNSGKTNTEKIIFHELVETALIREVHTYGKVVPCKENQKYYEDNEILFEQNDINKPQHTGFGKKLIQRAEEIAKEHNYKKIAVIAGVGVREYYRKLGYTTESKEGNYQIKILEDRKFKKILNSIKNKIKIAITILIIIIFYYILFLLLR
jgi:ELP3 family radical SAM enzyme/protein acetyltransferase